VNKDNLISAVFGILLGFIAGYLLHEVMASRQPQRLAAGQIPGQNPMTAAPPGMSEAQQRQQQMQQQAEMAAAQAQQAVQQLEPYVQDHPDDADAMRRLANAYFDLEQWDRARDLYSRVLQLQPDNVEVISDLGIVYRGLKDYDKALAQFAEAQRLMPDHWQSRYNQVIVLLDLKRYDEAEKVMQELQRLQPGNPNVTQLAAEVQRQRSAA